MNATTYGLDVAKRVFQMYWVDAQTGEIANRRFGRDDLIAFLAERPAGRVALEACGSAHWWARKIRALGHEVVLLHAQFIRPFVQTNKTDPGPELPEDVVMHTRSKYIEAFERLTTIPFPAYRENPSVVLG